MIDSPNVDFARLISELPEILIGNSAASNQYLFDVDGTLTPSRGVIDPEFHDWFLAWAKKNNVYLVTGSDYQKTVEQIGVNILQHVQGCFNCSGNVFYIKDKLVSKQEWRLSGEQWRWLLQKLESSPYPYRFGNHIEERTGTTNFSIVGRNAVGQQRLDYYKWDLEHNERRAIAQEFRDMFPELEAQVGGETGIDIFPVGKDKGQVLDMIQAIANLDNMFWFFGDRCDQGGNDYPLAKRIIAKSGVVFPVSGWRETWQILKNLKSTL